MNKKGADTRTILWTFYILLVLIITYFLYNFVTDVASGKGFTKKYFINDLGLTFDTLASANHDLEIKYKNLENYYIRFSRGDIKIINENFNYNYVHDNNFNTIYNDINIKEDSELLISKKDNTISVNTKENEAK